MDPLGQWADWMRAEGASDKTVQTRLGGISSLLGHAGRTNPVSIATTDIIGWLADCRSPWTRRTYATTARLWHRWLNEQGIRTDDPMARLRHPPQPRGVPRPASSQALDAALEMAPRRARAYILLAAFEGLRVHEVAKIRGQDFDDGWLYVAGKGDDVDAVPVHELVAQLCRGWPDEGWWFPGQTCTGHVLPNSVSRTISQTFHRCGYDVTAHQLRHWFGTHTLRITRDVRTTQELLRHRSISSTAIYTKVADRAKQDAVRRLTNGH